MILSMVSWKGGCGKTTSSVHFAALLSKQGRTLLVDEDRSRNASNWAGRGDLPFNVTDPRGMMTHLRQHEHVVVDTRGGMEDQDLLELYENSDTLIIPTVVDSMSLESMLSTVATLRKHERGSEKLRVLFTRASRETEGDIREARELVSNLGIQPLRTTIRNTKAFKDACDLGVLAYQVRNPQGKLGWFDYERAFKEFR